MIEIDNNVAELLRLIEKSAHMQVLKKAVFSKSDGGDVLKAVITPKSVAGEDVLQIESFHSDNKAKHKNIKFNESETLAALAESFSQINLITTAGDCEFKRSKSGKTVLLGGAKLEKALFADYGEGVKTYARVTASRLNYYRVFVDLAVFKR